MRLKNPANAEERLRNIEAGLSKAREVKIE